MTIKQWQGNAELVTWAKHLFNQGNWTLLLQVMEEMHPRHSQLPPVASDSVKSTELGRIYGYDIALNNLTVLTQAEQIRIPVEPDFGSDEIMARQNAPLTKPPVAPK